ncbi:uncharacterized protein LOC129813515 [Salvelinus fontinalis]|uniref:uncharacterized protein LOC129813515 n=1 Tax=Salvelinus fontinalis TaxID=8038 RepID=UPI002485B036|nr:uncharacterized protein LOC129813515 [Salvelinus fontinalis]
MSSPGVTRNAPITENCATSAKALLLNITEALTQVRHKDTFSNTLLDCRLRYRLHFKFISVAYSLNTYDKCLRNIEDDPRCYSDMLQAIDPELLGLTVLQNLKEIKEYVTLQITQGCRPTQGTINQNPFDERIHLCKVLKGFRVRTITINRIIGYIHAGDPNMKGGILIIDQACWRISLIIDQACWRIFLIIDQACWRIFLIIDQACWRIFLIIDQACWRIFLIIDQACWRIFLIIDQACWRIFLIIDQACWRIFLIIDQACWRLSLIIDQACWRIFLIIDQACWRISLIIDQACWRIFLIIDQACWRIFLIIDQACWRISLIIDQACWRIFLIIDQACWRIFLIIDQACWRIFLIPIIVFLTVHSRDLSI